MYQEFSCRFSYSISLSTSPLRITTKFSEIEFAVVEYNGWRNFSIQCSMGCGFSSDKNRINISNNGNINSLSDTERYVKLFCTSRRYLYYGKIWTTCAFIFITRCSNNVHYISSTMGTSQSKRNKISKFRTSSVGTVGELDEQDEDRILNNAGKLSSMKGTWFHSLTQVFSVNNILNKNVFNSFIFTNSYFSANNNSRNSSETNKKDYNNANNGNNFLQTNK